MRECASDREMKERMRIAEVLKAARSLNKVIAYKYPFFLTAAVCDATYTLRDEYMRECLHINILPDSH